MFLFHTSMLFINVLFIYILVVYKDKSCLTIIAELFDNNNASVLTRLTRIT